MYGDKTITADKIAAVFLDMKKCISDFEDENPFIPGQTNPALYTSLLLDTLYKTYFRPDTFKHGKPRTLIDTSDVNLVINVWDFYRWLCLKYGSTPTLQRFRSFTGINDDTLASWERGEYRTAEHSAAVKMFKQDAEADLLSRAIDSNSIGAIFALKANYGYNDNQPQTLTVKRDDMPQLTQEEIRQRLELMEDE